MKVNAKIVAPLVALLIIAGGLTAFLLTQDPDDKPAPKTSSKQEPKSTGTYVPEDVLQKSAEYKDRIISLKGQAYRINKEFFVVGSSATPAAVRLDFSKTSLDPLDYATISEETKTPGEAYVAKDSFTFTGKYTQTQTNGPFVLVVSSVK